MAAKLGEIQSQTSCPTIQTPLSANKVLREAQETSQVSIRYLPIPVSQLTFVSFGDASFASAKNLSSHQGVLICATDDSLDRNCEAPIVRSTLSAEAYAMSQAVDILGWVRALWGAIHVSTFRWQEPEVSFKQLRTATIVTDCKSLYDLVTRLAMPSCEEFRTTLEVLLTKPMDPILLRTVLAQGRFRLYDASENLWPPQSPFSSTSSVGKSPEG